MGNETKDTGYAAPQWAFDVEVTRVFDDMLARSIPQYDVMRESVTGLALRYVYPNSDILDLGCSRGEAMAPLVEKLGKSNRFVGIEKSRPMLSVCRDRFASQIAEGYVEILDVDLRYTFPDIAPSVALSILFLQFVPIEYRQKLVSSVYQAMRYGGAFIVVEKVLGSTASIDQDFVECYYEMKRKNGYSQEEIDRKKLALEGVLVPVTAKWNEEILAGAGFKDIECFWRWMNFAGWIAKK